VPRKLTRTARRVAQVNERSENQCAADVTPTSVCAASRTAGASGFFAAPDEFCRGRGTEPSAADCSLPHLTLNSAIVAASRGGVPHRADDAVPHHAVGN